MLRLGELISNHLGDGSAYGVTIRYSTEETLLETGGGIVKARPLLQHKPFWLLNGDIYTDFDFSSLPEQPPAPDLAHIVLTPTPEYREQGDFEYAAGRVTSRGQHYVYCGIAVLSPQLFEGIDLSHFSLRDLYFDLIERGRISAQVHSGAWHDIGTVAQYQALAAQLE